MSLLLAFCPVVDVFWCSVRSVKNKRVYWIINFKKNIYIKYWVFEKKIQKSQFRKCVLKNDWFRSLFVYNIYWIVIFKNKLAVRADCFPSRITNSKPLIAPDNDFSSSPDIFNAVRKQFDIAKRWKGWINCHFLCVLTFFL